MKDNELNEKLALWRGFTRFGINTWLEPDKQCSCNGVVTLPDFANNEKECFEWLVPWIKDLNSIHLYPTTVCYENPPYSKGWRWVFNITGIPVSREIDAKSLAEAINQFINVNNVLVGDWGL